MVPPSMTGVPSVGAAAEPVPPGNDLVHGMNGDGPVQNGPAGLYALLIADAGGAAHLAVGPGGQYLLLALVQPRRLAIGNVVGDGLGINLQAGGGDGSVCRLHGSHRCWKRPPPVRSHRCPPHPGSGRLHPERHPGPLRKSCGPGSGRRR